MGNCNGHGDPGGGESILEAGGGEGGPLSGGFSVVYSCHFALGTLIITFGVLGSWLQSTPNFPASLGAPCLA